MDFLTNLKIKKVNVLSSFFKNYFANSLQHYSINLEYQKKGAELHHLKKRVFFWCRLL